MINYVDEITVGFTEDEFNEISSKLRKHLEQKQEGSLIDYILDFCTSYSYRIEDIAEIIDKSKDLKNIIKADCVYHKIFRVENKPDKW